MHKNKEYSYSGFKNRGGVYSMRPQITARIFYAGRQREMACLVDSGSDYTVVDAEYADVLGIDLSEITPTYMGGVVGTGIKAYSADVFFEFDDFDERFKIKARFVKGMSFDAILGQSDFFEIFKICFEKKRNKFYLTQENNS